MPSQAMSEEGGRGDWTEAGEKARGRRGRDGSEAATGQGRLPGPEAWDAEQSLPGGLPREHRPADTLIWGQNYISETDVGLVAFASGRKIPVAKSASLW